MNNKVTATKKRKMRPRWNPTRIECIPVSQSEGEYKMMVKTLADIIYHEIREHNKKHVLTGMDLKQKS